MLKLKNRYDDEKLCNNPDKGWYVHYYDNGLGKYCTHYDLTDTIDDFPLMDHAYLRLAWGYLEPKEGERMAIHFCKVCGGQRFDGWYRHRQLRQSYLPSG